MYYSRGKVTRQAHVDVPPGTYEEEYAREGFFGPVSHLYRSAPPVDWIAIEGDLRPEALNTRQLPGIGGDWLHGRIPFLRNADAVLSYGVLATPMPYYFRNADGDELLFAHAGAGRIETDFGNLDYRRGDYLVIPRGTVYRLAPTHLSEFLVVETAAALGIPDRGIAGKHALFDPAVIDVPELGELPEPGRAWDLRIKRLDRMTTVRYPHNPITTVGWRGDLTVMRLNVDDIRPMMSERYHLPPTAHVTWMAKNVVICSFLPRGLETGDPGALKVPFYHSNVDYDEVLFYHDGEFFSRKGIEPGMVTFHPQGIHHGPQPGAVRSAGARTRTNEKAVMIDTRNPLELTDAGRRASLPSYWKSWQEDAQAGARQSVSVSVPAGAPASASVSASPAAKGDAGVGATRAAPHDRASNPCGLRGIGFVEFATRDPRELAQLFRAFGFSRTGRHQHLAIDAWVQNDITFLLNHDARTFGAGFFERHGPSICAMGWRVDDAAAAFASAVSRGARPYTGSGTTITVPAIYGIGDSLIYFLDHGHTLDTSFGAHPSPILVPQKGFTAIDHLTNNVEKGTMQRWASFYKDVFGFTEVRYFDIRGVKTGLQSYALRSPDGSFCIPINEGSEKRSQIEEYLREYNGPGVQHLAFLTADLLGSLDALEGSGIEMLDIDDDYYATVFSRVPNVTEDHARIRDHQVLVDGDSEGYLLQIFTKNLVGPIFIELIQRKNHTSFGEGNFGALFRSIERDQERRGALA